MDYAIENYVIQTYTNPVILREFIALFVFSRVLFGLAGLSGPCAHKPVEWEIEVEWELACTEILAKVDAPEDNQKLDLAAIE